MGGQTLSSSATRIEALDLQSSCYGATIPLGWGVAQLSVNLLWYGGFKAISHTSTTGGGGKGGGVTQQSTTYTYTADVMMAICHGPITSISRIWKGKSLYSGGVTPSQIVTVTETYSVPGTGVMTYPLAQAARFASFGNVTRRVIAADGVFSTATLASGKDYSFENGIVTVLNTALRGATLSITYQYTSGTVATTALDALHLTLIKGNFGQAAWSGLAGYGSQSIGYSGLALVAGQAYDLGNAAQVANHMVEAVLPWAYHLGPSQPDVDPSLVMRDALAGARAGVQMPPDYLDAMQSWSDYCVANSLLVSPTLTEQVSAADMLSTATKLTNSAAIWSGGRLKVIPYGDTSATANGRTFTPNTTPVYDLDDTVWIDPQDGTSPLQYTLTSPADRKNLVKIEYLDRTQQYSTAIAEASDLTDISVNGPQPMDVISAHWIKDGAIARRVAQLILQRSLYVVGTYSAPLPWHYAALEPTDLVTLSDAPLLMSLLPARVTSVVENDDGDLQLSFEDYPAGVVSHTEYPNQGQSGYQHDYNVASGNAGTPIVFEAPAGKTISGLALKVAVVAGASANWGGAQVWISQDGNNYKLAGTVYGGARAGTLSAAVASGASSIGVMGITAGQLLSGSAADATALNTLCYIGGATPEYLAYQAAALTGPGAYTLTGAVRGAYSTPSAAHASGDTFVRVDTAVTQFDDLDISMVGKSIFVKLCSFNIYGGAQQGLADVSATSYTITGYMAALPPVSPTSLTASLEPFGVRLIAGKSPDLDVIRYEFRVGATWATATVIEAAAGTSYLWQVQAVGTFTFWCACVDTYGAYSAPISQVQTVAAGTITGLDQAVNGSSLVLSWRGVVGGFANAAYEVRYGASFAAGISLGIYSINVYKEVVQWGGTRQYWIAPIDVKGNYGTASSVFVAITSPGSVSGQRADVVDNNVLLYWNAPSSGTVPVDHYEVRKGATWAGGTLIGSNGNSTFAGVFEQLQGTYTYWIGAWDTAGNLGTPVSIVATVNQPPDYILRTNFNSALTGTLSNMYMEAGALIGPVNTSTTWATHFTGNGWASPQDQITAGYPIYAEPSVTSGTYTETFDYGTIVAATLVTITVNSTALAGTESVSCVISTSPDNVTYTPQPAGFSALCAAFRYVRFVVTVSGSPGANLIQINAINVKLSIKQRMDSGLSTSIVGGVAVNFGYPFIEADYPMVQAGGLDAFSKPYTVAVIYTGAPNPTSFSVRIFNSAGTEVAGVPFSWTARGY